MAYVPINTQAFVSAYAGALSGMAVSGWVTDAVPADYETITEIAGAFAQAFDLAWNDAADLDNLQLRDVVTLSQQEFAGRGPSLSKPEFLQSATWAVPAAAIVALVQEADAYFVSQGINPGTPSPGGSVEPTQHLYFLDPDFSGTSNGSIAQPFTEFSEFFDIVAAGDAQSGWKLMLPATNAAAITPDASLPTLPEILKKVVFEGFASNGGETVLTELQVEPQSQSPEITFQNLVISALIATGNGNVSGDFNIDNSQVAGVSPAAEESAWAAAFVVKNGANLSQVDAPDSSISATDSNISGEIDIGFIECFQCSVGCVSLNLPDGSSNKFIGCTFTQAFAITGDCTITFDLYSWASFLAAGCTFAGTKIFVPSGVVLIASFGVPHNGDIAEDQFLGPFSTEPHAAESRCQLTIPSGYEIVALGINADPNGGVTGTTNIVLRADTGGGFGDLATASLAVGQNTNLVTTSIMVTAGTKFTAKLEDAPDAGTSAYSLSIYGRPLLGS